MKSGTVNRLATPLKSENGWITSHPTFEKTCCGNPFS